MPSRESETRVGLFLVMIYPGIQNGTIIYRPVGFSVLLRSLHLFVYRFRNLFYQSTVDIFYRRKLVIHEKKIHRRKEKPIRF